MKKFSMFLFAAFFAATAAADEGMWLLPYLQKMNIADMRAKGCELSAEEIYAADRSSLKDRSSSSVRDVRARWSRPRDCC